MAERRRGRLWGKILLTLVLLVGVGLTGAYWYMRPLLLTGTGYAAHNACAVQHISERTDPESDLPPNPLVPYIRTSTGDGYVEASILGVLAKQRAWFTEGFGCTLADQRPDLPDATPVTDANPLLSAPATAPNPDIEAAVDAAFADGLGTRAVIVLHDGQIVAERYADGFTAETPQLGWSMAKSVTNLLVGRAVVEHDFDVDATGLVEDWTDERAQITPEHLMRMTGGLEWDEKYDLGTPITAMLYLEEDMGEYMEGRDLAFGVGEHFQYSTGSTNLLCSILVDDVDADSNLPRDLLLAPIGLPFAQWEPDAVGTPVCGSYLWATPREWAAIGQFVLDDGVIDGERLLPDGWLADSVVDTEPGTQTPPGYGAGWWLNQRGDGDLTNDALPADAFWASGHDGQQLFVVPSADLVVVRMGFSPNIGGSALKTHELVATAVETLAAEG